MSFLRDKSFDLLKVQLIAAGNLIVHAERSLVRDMRNVKYVSTDVVFDLVDDDVADIGFVQDLNGQLAQYRKSHLAQVGRLEFNPTGVSPETTAVAKALGSCLVDSPDLQAALVSILARRDRQQISERLDTAEALIVEAVLGLSRGGGDQVYAREIAVEVNRLVEVRGERSKLSPEKVGHRLRKLGLPTRRLSQAGNGLVMDKETIAQLQKLSAMYVGKDWVSQAEDLPSLQTTENRDIQEGM